MVLLDLPHGADYLVLGFREAGVQPRSVERTRDMGVKRFMVANGFGCSIADIRLGTDRVPDGGRLASLPISGRVRATRIGLLLPQGRPRRTVAAFVDQCRSRLTDAALPGLAAP